MTAFRKHFLLLFGAIFAPAKMLACATCFGGNIDSPMADAMNWGIFTLLAVVGTILLAFLAFLIHIIRKSEIAAAAAEKTIKISQV